MTAHHGDIEGKSDHHRGLTCTILISQQSTKFRLLHKWESTKALFWFYNNYSCASKILRILNHVSSDLLEQQHRRRKKEKGLLESKVFNGEMEESEIELKKKG